MNDTFRLNSAILYLIGKVTAGVVSETTANNPDILYTPTSKDSIESFTEIIDNVIVLKMSNKLKG